MLTGALALYGTAVGDPIGLTGLFNARGTSQPFHIHDHASHLHLKAGAPVDVAIVGAQLDPAGQTGWHTHPADSIVSVQPGGAALTMVTRRHAALRDAHLPARPGLRPSRRAAQLPQRHHEHRCGSASPTSSRSGATLLTNVTAPKACA